MLISYYYPCFYNCHDLYEVLASARLTAVHLKLYNIIILFNSNKTLLVRTFMFCGTYISNEGDCRLSTEIRHPTLPYSFLDCGIHNCCGPSKPLNALATGCNTVIAQSDLMCSPGVKVTNAGICTSTSTLLCYVHILIIQYWFCISIFLNLMMIFVKLYEGFKILRFFIITLSKPKLLFTDRQVIRLANKLRINGQ